VGYELLPPSILDDGGIRDTTISGTSRETDFQSEEAEGTSGGSPRLIVADTLGMGARILLHFQTPPLDTVMFRSAAFMLTLRDVDSTFVPPRILAYELVQPFSEGITGSSMFPAYDPVPIAEAVFEPAIGDTAARYRFEGPGVDSVYKEWITGRHINAGIMLALESGESARVLFYSRDAVVGAIESRPITHVLFRPESATAADSLDTLRALPTGDVFVAERLSGSLAGVPGRLTVANGVPAATLLEFDLTTPEPRIIHRALLRLSIDTSASLSDSMLLLAEAIVDSAWSGEDTRTTSTGSALGVLTMESGVPTVTFVITPFAREWSLGPDRNHGVKVRAADEFGDLSWIRFYDSSAPDSLRPRLDMTSSLLTGLSE
jgi:hypothetical protein